MGAGTRGRPVEQQGVDEERRDDRRDGVVCGRPGGAGRLEHALERREQVVDVPVPQGDGGGIDRGGGRQRLEEGADGLVAEPVAERVDLGVQVRRGDRRTASAAGSAPPR